jgi:membrane protein implicated in regulation of membrane protease activity
MFQSSFSELFWFILGIVLFLAELIVPGFVIFFFGVGAWITALCIWIGIAPTDAIQMLIFLISSLGVLVLFRKKGRDYFLGKVSGLLGRDQFIDDIRGERAVVMRDIAPGALGGKVEFHGTLWDAAASEAIAKDTTVEILDRKDLTLIVRRV